MTTERISFSATSTSLQAPTIASNMSGTLQQQQQQQQAQYAQHTTQQRIQQRQQQQQQQQQQKLQLPLSNNASSSSTTTSNGSISTNRSNSATAMYEVNFTRTSSAVESPTNVTAVATNPGAQISPTQAQTTQFQHTPQLQFASATVHHFGSSNSSSNGVVSNNVGNNHNHHPNNNIIIINKRSINQKHDSSLHSHRQNHNTEKLPAFSFADRSTQSVSVPEVISTSAGASSLSLSQNSQPLRVAPSVSAVPFVSHQSQSQTLAVDCGPSVILKSIEFDDDDYNNDNNNHDDYDDIKHDNHDKHKTHHDHDQDDQQITNTNTNNIKQRHNYNYHTRRANSEQPPTVSNTPLRPAIHEGLKQQPSSSYLLSTPARNSVVEQNTSSLQFADTSLPFQTRRGAARSSLGSSVSDGPSHSLKRAAEGSSNAGTSTGTAASASRTAPDALTPLDSVHYQKEKELVLLKSPISNTPDERRVSFQRPPVSYKPPPNAPPAQSAHLTPIRVAPIRGFRSSGSRRSLNLDNMNYKSRTWDVSDESPNDTGFDRTLRALEGRQIADVLHMTPPIQSRYRGQDTDGDDGGDIFLRIARDEANQRSANANANTGLNRNDSMPDESQTPLSPMSRVQRTHRRPLSTTVTPYQPTSPPPTSRRRMSDQLERAQTSLEESHLARHSAQRATVIANKAMSAHPLDDPTRSRTGGAVLRPSPLAPRPPVQQEPESPVHKRRRSSVTEQITVPTVRSSGYRPSVATPGQAGNSKASAYNSSPLVRSFDFTTPRESETTHEQVEGTESTASTTAPSTVWDELDELKSRIHRLELTGKLPPTSAAAVSRMTDERPPTANTAVTAISSSPKRPGAGQPNEVMVSQRDYPILLSALSRSKPFLKPDIYKALEAAATDAMALSSMMGVAGQPGPISSGASTIGSGSNVTDRQLRRKADSVCRSLTELCVALGEDVAQTRPVQVSEAKTSYVSQAQNQQPPQPVQGPGPSTPTMGKPANAFSDSRRPSFAVEQNMLPNPQTSPSRSMSKFEERRNTLLNSSQITSPRASASGPLTFQDPIVNRKSSLLITRTRRAATEEPEEPQFSGRRSSLLLRSRRAGTEEPEEGRQTTLLRNRRGTIDGDEDRFGAPSRAYTEISGRRGSKQYTEVATTSRGPTRSYVPQSQRDAQEATQRLSALPQRRFMSSSVSTSRLTTPAPLPTRKYLERSVPDRDPIERERHQRYYSMSQAGVSSSRASSLRRGTRDRDSPMTNVSTTATAGGYQ